MRKGTKAKEMEMIKTQIDETKTNTDLPREWRTLRYHPLDNIIGGISKGVTT